MFDSKPTPLYELLKEGGTQFNVPHFSQEGLHLRYTNRRLRIGISPKNIVPGFPVFRHPLADGFHQQSNVQPFSSDLREGSEFRFRTGECGGRLFSTEALEGTVFPRNDTAAY